MKSCLLVIDVQESFRHRPYFSEAALPVYLAAQNSQTMEHYGWKPDLNDGTGAAGVDYESKIYPEGEKATVAAAPALNG